VAESLFPATAPSLDFDDADGSPGLSLHTLIQPQVAGYITYVRRWRSVTPPSFEIGSLWTRTSEGAGEQVAESIDWQGSGGAVGAVGWDVALLDPPIAVAALDKVYACLTTDRFVSATDPSKPFKAGDVTSSGGLLIAPGDDSGTPQRNGRFAAGGATPTFPDSSGGNCYFVDVVFEEAPASQPVDPAEETDEARPLARIKQRLLGVVDDIGSALVLGGIKRRALGLATESDVTLSFGVGASGSTVVPQPSAGTVGRPDDGIIHRPEVAYP